MKKNISVLHIIKTNTGAIWAYRQIAQLIRMGIKITVMLPQGDTGLALKYQELGIKVIEFDASLPIRAPWLMHRRMSAFQSIIEELKPDLIHCHFVTNIMFCRFTLRKSTIPRLFQVPGPLHLDNILFRYAEVLSGNQYDYWAGSCHNTCRIYQSMGIPRERIFFGYYAGDFDQYARQSRRTGILRKEYHIPEKTFLIGMVSYFYKPKRYLLQFSGIKGHEDFIKAFALLLKQYPDARAVIIGGAAPHSERYQSHIMSMARKRCGDAIIFTGFREDILKIYPDLDLAVHPSRSENYGGCGESLAMGVPTLTTDVGGFPELIKDKVTGYMVPAADPIRLYQKLDYIMKHREEAKLTALKGQKRVRKINSRLSAEQARSMYYRILGRRIKVVRRSVQRFKGSVI